MTEQEKKDLEHFDKAMDRNNWTGVIYNGVEINKKDIKDENK